MRNGKIVPEWAYQITILKTLIKLGGSAETYRVYSVIKQDFPKLASGENSENYKTGDVIWQNQIRRARQHLVDAGYMKKDSQRGLWEISDNGRIRYEEIKSESTARKNQSSKK